MAIHLQSEYIIVENETVVNTVFKHKMPLLINKTMGLATSF